MGTGSIFHREADDRWIAQISSGTGSKRVVVRRVARSYSEAQRLLRELRVTYTPTRSSTTVGDYLAEWLETVRRDVKASTWVTYEIAVRRHIVPAIGDVAIGDLTHDHVERMTRALTGSPKGIRNALSVLSGALTEARRRKLVTENVADLVKRPRLVRKRRSALTDADVAKLRAAVAGDRLEALYLVALAGGLRMAEILGLLWSDWDGESVTVQRALTRIDGVYDFAEPKTESSVRTVPLPEYVNDALRRHHAAQTQERLAAGPGTEEGLIFTAPTGRPISGGWLSHRWSKIAERCGVQVTFHGLRHQHISELVHDGFDPKSIADRVGHARIATTMEVYAHVGPASGKRIAEHLQRKVSAG
jgi:integrase